MVKKLTNEQKLRGHVKTSISSYELMSSVNIAWAIFYGLKEIADKMPKQSRDL